jgi:hypothetical protein
LKKSLSGYIIQSRKAKNDTTWQDCFSHILPGPITHYSTLNDRFAVLYHTVTDENIDYYARVYYPLDGNTEYKDFHLPGSTIIRSFTLEETTLLYSRYANSKNACNVEPILIFSICKVIRMSIGLG